MERTDTAERSSEWNLILMCGAAAAVGQYLLDHGDSPAIAVVPFAVAALFMLGLFRNATLESSAECPSTLQRVRWCLVPPAILFGALAFPRFSDNQFTSIGTRLWLAGLVFLGMAAWWPRDQFAVRPRDQFAVRPRDQSAARQRGRWWKGVTLTWVHLALLGILVVAAFFRLHKIDRIPLEMGCDLPHIYNNIRLVLRSEYLVFFSSHPGREGLFFYLAAPFCRLFGLNYTTIKMSSALIGLATIPAVYLLGRELYDREVGLWAALLMGISHWHIILARVGFRSCTMPLVLVLMWYFWARALRTGRRWFFALAGLFLGLGLYTYNAFLIVPLVVVGMLLVRWLAVGGRLWRHWDGLAIMALVALYVFIPLGRYAYDNPQQYLFRVATRVTSLEATVAESPLKVFAGTSLKALLMFNFRGDAVFINNVPFYRELGFLAAILFFLGLVYAVWRWRRGMNGMVVVGLLGMLLPTSLSLAFPHEVPNAGRALGALPVAMILAGLGLTLLRRRIAGLLARSAVGQVRVRVSLDDQPRIDWQLPWGRTRRFAWVLLLVAALFLEARAVYPLYFEDYAAHLPDGGYSISLAMAQAIDDFADDGESYVKVMPYWHDGNAVRAQLTREDQSWHNELVELLRDQPPFAGSPGKFMVILHPSDSSSLQILQEAFPQGIALRHTRADAGSEQGRQLAFITFYGERR